MPRLTQHSIPAGAFFTMFSRLFQNSAPCDSGARCKRVWSIRISTLDKAKVTEGAPLKKDKAKVHLNRLASKNEEGLVKLEPGYHRDAVSNIQ